LEAHNDCSALVDEKLGQNEEAAEKVESTVPEEQGIWVALPDDCKLGEDGHWEVQTHSAGCYSPCGDGQERTGVRNLCPLVSAHISHRTSVV